MNIHFITNGSRCLIEPELLGSKPINGKIGIRCHGELFGSIRSIIGLAYPISDVKGTIHYINSNSLNKWLSHYGYEVHIRSEAVQAISKIVESAKTVFPAEDQSKEVPAKNEREHDPSLDWKLKVQTAINQKNYTEAIQWLNRIVATTPWETEAWIQRGECYFSLSEYEKAADDFKKALDLDPKNRKTVELVKNCTKAITEEALASKNYDDAILFLKDALHNKHQRTFALDCLITLYKDKAEQLFNKKDFHAAIEVYDKILELMPKNDSALARRAACYGGLGKFGIAEKGFKKALKINPNQPFAIHQYCELLFDEAQKRLENKEIEKTELLINRYLELNPKEPLVWIIRGHLLHLQDKYKAERKNYTEAIIHHPNFAELWFLRGMVSHKLNSLKKATKDLNKSLDLAPSEYKAHYALGIIAAQQSKFSEAILHFSKGIEVDANTLPSILLERARAYNETGQYAKAIEDCDRALKINPEDKLIQKTREIALSSLPWYKRIGKK